VFKRSIELLVKLYLTYFANKQEDGTEHTSVMPHAITSKQRVHVYTISPNS